MINKRQSHIFVFYSSLLSQTQRYTHNEGNITTQHTQQRYQKPHTAPLIQPKPWLSPHFFIDGNEDGVKKFTNIKF